MYESAGLGEHILFTILQMCESAGLKEMLDTPPQCFSNQSPKVKVFF
jgi:hypothetical protein